MPLLIAACSILLSGHLLGSRWDLSAVIGSALWLSLLALRAAVTVIFALLVLAHDLVGQAVAWLPDSNIQTPLPLFQTHVLLSAHAIRDLAAFIPLALLITSLAVSGLAIWRATQAVSDWLAESKIGVGPAGSVIVRNSRPMLGAAGVRHPVVVISAAALVSLDDAELSGALQHELGHINRRHRFLMIFAGGLAALARPLPGGRRAFGNLRYYLERDADEYAVRQTGDPISLASAICKVAMANGSWSSPAFSGLGTGCLASRLQALIGETESPKRGLRFQWSGVALAMTLATLALALGSIPALAEAGVDQMHISMSSAGCD